MQLKNEQWTALDGGFRIYPIIERPNIVNSNTYILESEYGVAIIDHGGTAARAEKIENLLTPLLLEHPRPVVAVITHCHMDHLNGLYLYTPDFRRRLTVIFDRITQDLLNDKNDIEITNFRMFGSEAPRIQADLFFFGETEQEKDGVRIEKSGNSETVQVNGREILRAWRAPGHTPDSMFFQFRNLLFVGDTFYALNPGIVGLPGWNASMYQQTLRLLGSLSPKVEMFCPGHDHAKAKEEFEPLLEELLYKAKKYHRIADLTPERVGFLDEYTNILLDEAERFFTIISGRLYRLAHELGACGETELANELFGTLEFEEIEKVLHRFRVYRQESAGDQNSRIMELLKIIQTIRKIRQILEKSKFSDLLDSSLLRRVDTLMNDFINSISGIPFSEKKEQFEINAAMGEFLESLRRGCSAETHGAFSSEILNKFKALNIFDGRALELVPSPKPVIAELPKSFFQDIVQHILERLVSMRALQITVRVIRNGLIVSSDNFTGPLGEKIVNGYIRRSFSNMGCAVAYGEKEIYVIFPDLRLKRSLFAQEKKLE